MEVDLHNEPERVIDRGRRYLRHLKVKSNGVGDVFKRGIN
jgi:hypothetical protein